MGLRNHRSKIRNFNFIPAMVLAFAAVMAVAAPGVAQAVEITVYKSAQCMCCGNWVSYMRGRGYKMTVHNMDNLDTVKKMAGVPDLFSSGVSFDGWRDFSPPNGRPNPVMPTVPARTWRARRGTRPTSEVVVEALRRLVDPVDHGGA